MRSIVRWEPYSDLISLRNAMDRLFEKSAVRAPSYGPEWTTTAPLVDMYRTAKAVIIKAAVPGLKAEDLQITVHGEVLTIRGEVAHMDEESDKKYLCRECHYRVFERSVALPSGLNVNQTEAELVDGILTMRIPQAEAQQPKQIKIS